MENRKQSLTQLYQDFLAGRINPEQATRLKALFKSGDEDSLRSLVAETLNNPEIVINASDGEQKRLDNIYEKIKSEISTEKKKQPGFRFRSYTIVAFASIIVSIIGALLYLNRPRSVQTETVLAFSDVSPGSNKAILTLSDGSKISLTNVANGQMKRQQEAVKTGDGQLVYTANATIASSPKYNTLETPKGGQFQLVLPDGTKVWLNAASSLKYPICFATMKERKVELIGEAYFEVAHNKSLPFRVATQGQTVTVLGTHFNVNSYADEKNVTTTLEQGSVQVSAGKQIQVIRPGEQTLLSAEGAMIVQDANMQTALAWKEGKILFRDADIRTIMRQVSRWYDLDIVYQGNIPNRTFNGGVTRTAKLSSLLQILELNDIHFQLVNENGKKQLIVTQ